MSKSIFSKNEADKLAVSYSPRKFPTVVAPTALEFVSRQSQNSLSGFKIDKIVAEKTGIARMERLSIEEKVEQEALARLKDLEEQAYREAYRLGLEEGRQKAFAESRDELQEKMQSLKSVIAAIESLKVDLVGFNEAHIMRLIYYMAKRLMMDEISTRPEAVLSVVQQAAAAAQSDETITVRVAEEDFAFIEGAREELGTEFAVLGRARIESSPEIKPGGCIVQTNYGDVDATVERRLEKLWESIEEKMPQVKPVVGGS